MYNKYLIPLIALLLISGTFLFSSLDTVPPLTIQPHNQIAQVSSSLTDGLVGWWKFDEGSGTIATDSSGNGNTGTLVNNPTWVEGKVGGGLSFDGVDDYVNLGKDMIGVNAVSISAWINPASYGARGYAKIITNGNSDFGLFSISKTLLFASNIKTQMTADINSIPLNQWTFVTVTRDSSGLENLYVNGVLSGSPNRSGGVPNASTYTYIANNLYGTQGFNGLIDDVRLYNRILSVNDILQLYNYSNNNIVINNDAPESGEVIKNLPVITIPENEPVSVLQTEQSGLNRVFYIDYLNGLDTNLGTSKNNAWKHSPGDIKATDNPKITSLRPGDTIKFKGGVIYQVSDTTYVNMYGTTVISNNGITISKSGTSDAPIIYDGNTNGDWGTGKAIIDGGYVNKISLMAFEKNVSYVNINNFELRNAGGYADNDPVVLNAAAGLYGNSLNAIHVPLPGIGVSMIGQNNNVNLLNLYIHHIGIWHSTIGWDGRSVSGTGITAQSPKNLIIKNCELTKIGSGGIAIYAPLADVNNVLITDCYLHNDIPQWGIDIAPQRVGAKMENITITKTRFENIWSNWSGTNDDPSVSGTTAPHQNYIFIRQSASASFWNNININNNWFGETGATTLSGGTGAIFLSQGPSVNIYNNIFARNWSITGTIPIGYPVISGMHQIVRIYNNTFHRGSGSIITVSGQNPPGVKEVHIENNLLVNDPNLRANSVMIASDNIEPFKTLDYNMYWSPDWNSKTMYVATLSGYKKILELLVLGFEAHGYYSDPLFVDWLNPNKSLRNYHLQSGSPAIGAGRNLASFCSTLIGLCSDYDGNPRPTTGPWTIGAYEYPSGGGNPLPINASCSTTLNQCSIGIFNDITDTPTQYLWSCIGSNGGTTASCSLPKTSSPILGDFNNDNYINSLDISILFSNWNTQSTTCDLNKDGIVNSLDYVIVVKNWTV